MLDSPKPLGTEKRDPRVFYMGDVLNNESLMMSKLEQTKPVQHLGKAKEFFICKEVFLRNQRLDDGKISQSCVVLCIFSFYGLIYVASYWC